MSIFEIYAKLMVIGKNGTGINDTGKNGTGINDTGKNSTRIPLLRKKWHLDRRIQHH